jgi:hypothetical protein
MRFDLFHACVDAHVRKEQQYLQEVNVARLEHHVAPEHHSALASMYAERVAWLERELSESVMRFDLPLRGVASAPPGGLKRTAESPMTLPRAQ